MHKTSYGAPHRRRTTGARTTAPERDGGGLYTPACPLVLHVDANGPTCADAQVATAWHGPGPVSYTHLTLPTIYSV